MIKLTKPESQLLTDLAKEMLNSLRGLDLQITGDINSLLKVLKSQGPVSSEHKLLIQTLIDGNDWNKESAPLIESIQAKLDDDGSSGGVY